jgi:hypothetical protein
VKVVQELMVVKAAVAAVVINIKNLL